MAKFDPDAYLAKKPASKGFDPDAYLAAGTPAAPVTPPGQIPVDNRVQAPAAVPSDVPLGRRIINMVRPTVEALGGVGGGVLGTALGPAGTVGGAGLGYGLTKGGLDSLETALGYRQGPQTATEALAGGAKDVLTGATLEAGGRAVGPVLSKVVDKAATFGRAAPKAAQIARDAAGQDLPALKNALAAAQGQNVTAGQATAGVTNPTWQALGDRALRLDPRFTNKLAATQDAEAVNALARAAGGDTAAATRATSEQAQKNLNTITGPMREEALKRANLGKFVADAAAVREASDLAVMVGSGGKIDPVRFAAQATGAEKALRSNGIQPLNTDALTSRIRGVLSSPDLAANKPVKAVVDQLAEDLAEWTGKGGVIDADALYSIRKNSADEAIRKLMNGAAESVQKKTAASVMERIKPLIDDAIKKAGGGDAWKAYLDRHAEGMQRIAEKKLMDEGLSLWKTNKDQFVKMVQNESPEAVEKILGPGKYDIARDLAESHMTVLREQAAKALRDKAVATQVTEGQEALKNLLLQDMSKIRLPSYLSVITSTTNKALDTLERALGRRTMSVLTEAMKTPKGASDLLSTLPPSERVKILQVLNNPQSWGLENRVALPMGFQMAKPIVDALSADSTSQNALAP
jgi:hypothetical protein